ASLRVSERVSFLGEVKDIAHLLGRASCFVLPSRTEGISLTILEAMARGLPVVATRVGGNPEVVLDGTPGLLVAPENPQALGNALLHRWRNQGEANGMGKAGRNRVEEHFNIAIMIERYEQLYKKIPKLLRGNAAGPGRPVAPTESPCLC